MGERGISEPSKTGISVVNDYRKTMVGLLVEAFRMTQQLLSGADFEKSFPHVFGLPSEDNPEVALRNECGLLIRKSQMHINAVLRANKNNNLHSLAVQMRVVLECAAQVFSKANAAAKGSPKELARVLNESEYDFQYSLASLSRGDIKQHQIRELIKSARIGIDQDRNRVPKRVTIADKIRGLSGGEQWYSHLSKFFCNGEANALRGRSFSGGVMSINTELDELTFAIFLDYLTEQVVKMLAGYGFLLIAINGDSQPFDEALHLLERKRSATKVFRGAGRQQNESK